MTLVEALERAGSLARKDAAAIFLEVLQLAVEGGSLLDADRLLVGEDGSLVPLTEPAQAALEPIDQVRAASALAVTLFGAAGTEPPFGLRPDLPGATDRFPTLRHLLDAFELQLLISRAPGAPPPPARVDCRMAVAALVARAQQARSPPAVEAPAQAGAQDAAASPPVRSPRWVGFAAAALVGAAIAVLVQRSLPGSSAAPAPPARPLQPAVASVFPAPALEEPLRPSAAADAAVPAPFRPSADARHRPLRRLRWRDGTEDTARLERARARLQLGDQALDEGRVFQALVAFRQALEDDPELLAALRGLGDAYRLHHDDPLAIDAYQRYLDIDPDGPDADEVRAALDEMRAAAN